MESQIEIETATQKNEPRAADQSLYGQIKYVKTTSPGFVKFCGKFILIILGTLFFTIFIALFMSIPITMIVIGSVYKDDCPAEKNIPIYLIVGGTFTLIQNIIILILRINAHKLMNDLQKEELNVSMSLTTIYCNLASTAVLAVVGLFLFAWFIAGNVWIYGTDVVTDDVSADNYCHKTLYNFAFWMTTLTYILAVLSGCCKCCTKNAEETNRSQL